VPLKITYVVGSRLDPSLSERIHRLELCNAVDELRLPGAELDRRQLLTTTERGQDLAIALPRHQRLFDGAVLLLEESRAILVRTAGQRWLRLAPHSICDAIELGYHVGRLGWRVRFEGEMLFVALDGRQENYMIRLGQLLWSRRVRMSVLEDEAGSDEAAAC
jgi:urease accessory protein